jgi:hypothetical protein
MNIKVHKITTTSMVRMKPLTLKEEHKVSVFEKGDEENISA